MMYSDDFVMDFARRTKTNLEFIKNEVMRQKENGIKEGEISVFEATQLINSFVGFLIFPKQRYFYNLDSNVEFRLERTVGIFEKIRNNPQEYQYSSTYWKFDTNLRNYDMNEYEELTAKNLILHLRNAIGHERLSVFPVNSATTEKIEGFTFKDQKKYAGEWMEFSIMIPIDDLEELIYGMCDLLLAHTGR